MTTTRARASAAGAALLLVALAGCGEDGSTAATDPAGSPSDSPSASQSASPTGEVDPDADPVVVDHPTGADDVVLRIETGGGYVPVEYAFTARPTLLLTGDGRLFVPPGAGEQTRLIAMEVAQLDEQQVQQLLELADEAGLLGEPPDYVDDSSPQVADAPTTTVTLSAAGGTWVHEVYALGFGDAAGPRQALSDFVEAATAAVADLETRPFEPDRLALLVQPTDLDGTVVPWPSDDVALAASEGCTVVPAAGLVEPLSTTDLTTTFREDGELYSVSATEVLPGDDPC